MEFKKIHLVGYKPLMLSGIHEIEWSPRSSYLIILGTNGSGKSSLMAECSPMPAVTGNYMNGGKKHVEIEHDNSTYLLTSTISTSARHSFIKDGEQLNAGGTATVQKELVMRFFSYDSEIHELLTGRTLFTKMSQNDRRKLITRMSSMDFTYAIRLYERLRAAATEMRGFLNLTKRRLTEETLSLSNMEYSEDLEGKIRTLQAELTELLYMRIPNAPAFDTVDKQMRTALAEFETQGRLVLELSDKAPAGHTLQEMETMAERIQSRHNAIDVEQRMLAQLYERHRELEKEIPPATEEHQSLEELEAYHAELQKAILVHASKVNRFGWLLSADDPVALLSASTEAIPMVLDVFSRLPDNKELRFNKAAMSKANEVRRSSIDAIAHDEGAIRLLNQKLHQMEHAKPETCPQCSYTWVPGVNSSDIPTLKSKRNDFQQHIENSRKIQLEAEKYLEEAEAYFECYRSWRGIVQQYPRLAYLWNYIQQERTDTDNPSQQRGVLIEWLEESRAAADYARAMAESARIDTLITLTKKGGNAKLKHWLVELEVEINGHASALQQLREAQTLDKHSLGLMKQLAEAITRWQDAIARIDSLYTLGMEAIANETVDKEIINGQSQLGASQHTQRSKEVLQGIINDLQKSIDKAEVDNAALMLLTKELSPKEGLIAEQLSGFITCLVAQLNSVISSVWSYELEVVPCAIKDGELDYHFPLRSGVNGPMVSDIDEGSRSMQEIINFAFAQTAMLYLGLNKYPLFIDELGSSFDEAHRPAINQFISRLMESQRYSQTFMISHYVAGWGSFSNAEYVVLDSRNITVPSNHNTTVRLA